MTIGVWSVFTNINGAVIAPGQINVETGRHIIQNRYGGSVSEIMVEENQYVKNGQILLRFRGDEIKTAIEAQKLIQANLLFSAARLRAEISKTDFSLSNELTMLAEADPRFSELADEQKRLFDIRTENLTNQDKLAAQQVKRIHNQISGANENLKILENQIQNSEDELERLEKLASKKIATISQVVSQQNKVNEYITRLASETTRLEDLKKSLELVYAEQRAAHSEWDQNSVEKLQAIEAEIKTTNANLKGLNERLEALEVTAPRDGFVYDLSVTSLGAVVSPSDPIMYIIPSGSNYLVKAAVASQNISDIFEKQSTEVAFPSLNARMTPKIRGEVTRITADARQDLQTGLTTYTVDIMISNKELEKLSKYRLRPGIPAEVFFITEQRSPLSYLLRPITDFLQKSLRET